MRDEKPEDLRPRTKRFALDVIRLYATLPKSTEAQVLGRQVLRSGTSVGANYREAYRSRSKVEFIARKLEIVSRNLRSPVIGLNYLPRVALWIHLTCFEFRMSVINFWPL